MIERLLAQSRGKQRRSLAIATLLAVLSALAGVGLLGLSGWFLTGAAIAGLAGTAAVQAFNYLLPSAGIRALAIIRTFGRYGERLFSHRATLHAIAELRPALFARLAGQDIGRSLTHAPGEIATQLGQDLDALEDQVVRRVTGPAAIAAAACALAAAWMAGLAAAIVLVLGLTAMRLTSRTLAAARLPALHREQAEALAALKASYDEFASCSAEIAVFGLVETVSDELASRAATLDRARMALVRQDAIVTGTLALIASVTAALLLLAAQGDAPLIALAALSVAAGLEIWSGLSRSDMQKPRIEAALKRLSHLSASPAAPHTASPDIASSASGLTIEHLDRIVQLERGDKLLVSGPSGAGKTRLVETMLALRADAPQTIRVAGRDIGTLPLAERRGLFAFAPQDAGLIAGTIADNLRMARPGVAEEDMWQALDTACIGNVVRALPGGLDYWLGGDNAALSGGQRKRLALARALLAKRDWLVLDEPTEGLDPDTEARLTANLEKWLERTGTGLLLVSHRAVPRRLAKRKLDLGPAD
ncbi:MAG: ATP-binding cassette domain-containing protein [Novosphingobium sp.]|nr:ATP-binding cassette domain-containing protein [Novosphingobium sp.]